MLPLDLNVLSLIVGLSVYVASIRFVIVGRLISEPPPSPARKEAYKNFLRSLVPADAGFLCAGLLLFLHLFWVNLGGTAPPAWFAAVIPWAFLVGALSLVLQHTYNYVKTFRP
jgi:hypothetical protein